MAFLESKASALFLSDALTVKVTITLFSPTCVRGETILEVLKITSQVGKIRSNETASYNYFRIGNLER